MKTIIAIVSFIALAQAGTLLPLDQSIVNVKSEKNGAEYSYSIQENRGIALEPLVPTIHHPIHTIPIVKTSQEVHQIHHIGGNEQIHSEKQQEGHQEQHIELKAGQPQAKAVHELTLPLVYTYPYQPATFYSHNIIPSYSYPYAYTYPYYRLNYNYNLYPLKAE